MEHRYDPRLPPEVQVRLRQVELQAEALERDELLRCLMAAWNGWMLERHMTNKALECLGVTVENRLPGFMPAEVCS